MESKKLTPLEISVCFKVASQAYNPKMLAHEDLKSELLIWCLENYGYLEQWREQGKHGTNKLSLSLKRHAAKLKVEAWLEANPLEASHILSSYSKRAIQKVYGELLAKKIRTSHALKVLEAYYSEDLSFEELQASTGLSSQKLKKILIPFEVEACMAYPFLSEKEAI